MTNTPGLPGNEIERLLTLSVLDLNYAELNDSLSQFTRLAAGIAGTEISLINLIDTYTQWSVARHGIDVEQMPREDSVCQYTILEDSSFEVEDLAGDDRFRDKSYVSGELGLKYYFGVPLKTDDGQNVGALCVLDKEPKVMDAAKTEMLQIIAGEIMVRLKSKKIIEQLRRRIADMTETQNKLAHDIRGPIAGVIGLSKLFKNRINTTSAEKLEEVFGMIENGGESVLTLAEDIMNDVRKKESRNRAIKNQQYNLANFKEAIEKLYLPMASSKNLRFDVKAATENSNVFFSKNMLMQISGNLISNAIKFTPAGGLVSVRLSLETSGTQNVLRIVVQDSGVGISRQTIDDIMNGTASSTDGTSGENGFGLGLCLVKRMVDTLEGTLELTSKLNHGTKFDIYLPQQNDGLQIMISEPAPEMVVQ